MRTRTSGTPWSRASVEGASVASSTDRWTDRPTDSHQTKFRGRLFSRPSKQSVAISSGGRRAFIDCMYKRSHAGVPEDAMPNSDCDHLAFHSVSRCFTPILRSSFDSRSISLQSRTIFDRFLQRLVLGAHARPSTRSNEIEQSRSSTTVERILKVDFDRRLQVEFGNSSIDE